MAARTSQSDHAAGIRGAWGESHFVQVPEHQLQRLNLSPSDSALLGGVGLPISPAASLRLQLRFETVDLRHTPEAVGRLAETNFQRTRFYPLTGDPDVDDWARLDRFVVIGEGPNDYEAGSYFSNRFICLDAASGRVSWVFPKPDRDGRSLCCLINTSLIGYLASLLAYKRFRDQWPQLETLSREAGDSSDDSEYRVVAGQIHSSFLRDLQLADPDGFSDGFWECHAWDEAILLEI